ncbi:MAG TPA: STAS domain-containing protein [Syntrophorhabdaceae bacterium]|jgi:anti-anti-sigma regulatory factor
MIEIKVEKSGDGATVVIGGEATIIHGEEMKKALTGTIGECATITVHTGGILETDLSCLQLLCSAHRMARRMNKELIFQRPPSVILEQTAGNLGYSRRSGCGLAGDDHCLFTGGPHE